MKLTISIKTVLIIAFTMVLKSTPVNSQKAYSGFINVSIGASGPPAEKAPSANKYTDPGLTGPIPKSRTMLAHRFAFIIGNENYSIHRLGLNDVEYAINDAEAFKRYAQTTFGIPDNNIIFRTNATTGILFAELERQVRILRLIPGKKELYFYYSGHGYPMVTDSSAGLVPVDANPLLANGPISLSYMLLKFASDSNTLVWAFTDACFTGETRTGSALMAQRGVRKVPAKNVLPDNVVHFSASQGNGPAFPLETAGHGLFTYCLLMEIRNALPRETWDQIFERTRYCVSLEAVRLGHHQQIPTVSTGYKMRDDWKRVAVLK